MRQTSRAVALLLALESARANDVVTAQDPVGLIKGGVYETVFVPKVSIEGEPDDSMQLNNINAGFTGKAQVWDANATAKSKTSGVTYVGWTDATARTAKIVAGTPALNANSVTVANGSGCVQCIRGAGVWCTRTYAYLSTADKMQYEFTAKEYNALVVATGKDGLIGGASLDQGACCDTVAAFQTFVGTKTAPVTSSTTVRTAPTKSNSLSGLKMVSPACPAIKSPSFSGTANAETFGASSIDDAKKDYTSWWCSNGLYKKVTKSDPSGTLELNSQQTITQAQNQRLELALVGCPQGKLMCGNKATMAVQLTDLAPKISIEMAGVGMTVLNKCTWVAYSTVSGPSFEFKQAAKIDANSGASPPVVAKASFGLDGTNWQIHAMEYTASAGTIYNASDASLISTADSVIQASAQSLNYGNYVPLFTMPANQFATLRTWYGEGSQTIDTVTQQTSSWLSPGQAPISNDLAVSTQLSTVPSQLYGNVANVPVSEAGVTPGSINKVGTFNYGKYNDVVYDLRQMRYFPAKVAQVQHLAGENAATKYKGVLSTYNTAKTTWDNYVAILEKNASQDAFAALFSPPKAPTVPPLPNKPWVPAAYSGYTRATAQEVAGWSANYKTYKSAASPTASQIWTNLAAAQTVGGWGSFTASIFTYRNGWGKSFGTIGYSGDADKLNMSDVWNYKWTCTATATKSTALSTSTQCAPTYAAPSPGALATTVTETTANAVNMVSMVSLWSTVMVQTSQTKQVWPSQNGLTITFSTGAWKSGIVGLKQIPLAEPATDAKSLTGLAGAQALVASSAAALAVAAALY